MAPRSSVVTLLFLLMTTVSSRALQPEGPTANECRDHIDAAIKNFLLGQQEDTTDALPTAEIYTRAQSNEDFVAEDPGDDDDDVPTTLDGHQETEDEETTIDTPETDHIKHDDKREVNADDDDDDDDHDGHDDEGHEGKGHEEGHDEQTDDDETEHAEKADDDEDADEENHAKIVVDDADDDEDHAKTVDEHGDDDEEKHAKKADDDDDDDDDDDEEHAKTVDEHDDEDDDDDEHAKKADEHDDDDEEEHAKKVDEEDDDDEEHAKTADEHDDDDDDEHAKKVDEHDGQKDHAKDVEDDDDDDDDDDKDGDKKDEAGQEEDKAEESALEQDDDDIEDQIEAPTAERFQRSVDEQGPHGSEAAAEDEDEDQEADHHADHPAEEDGADQDEAQADDGQDDDESDKPEEEDDGAAASADEAEDDDRPEVDQPAHVAEGDEVPDEPAGEPEEGAEEEEEGKGGDQEEEGKAGEGGDEEEEEEEVIVAGPGELRTRENIETILGLGEDKVDENKEREKIGSEILKDVKRMYEGAVRPLEQLYKFKDISTRQLGDAEIFSKPMVLFLGPWSTGKSAIINYLLGTEYSRYALKTGAEPTSNSFNVIMYGDSDQILDGTQLAADWAFSTVQKFGQSFLDRLRGRKMANPLLQKMTIVDSPGILENRKSTERQYPFNDAFQWFIDRADLIYIVFDPTKLDIGLELEAIFDQLKGRESQVRILLNKADTVKPQELMKVQGTLLWNLSPLLGTSEAPTVYVGSFWSRPYLPGSPETLLDAQEEAFLEDLHDALEHRVENKVALSRRHAVRVRNHAKMVDCYLNTYYNHKSFFSNKRKVADDIVENPQNYHIYEGLSILTNVSRYDLPDPDIYREFFRVHPLFDFKPLASTCSYFKGCPLDKLDIAIAYDLPELVGKYQRLMGNRNRG